MPTLLLSQRYLVISLSFAAVSVLLAVFSFAFAHGSPMVAIIVFGLLTPSLLLGSFLGINGSLTTSTLAFVFAVQFLTSYIICLLVVLSGIMEAKNKVRKTMPNPTVKFAPLRCAGTALKRSPLPSR